MKCLFQLRRMHPIGYLIAATTASVTSSLLVSCVLMMPGLSNDIHSRIGGGEYIAFGLFSILIAPIIESLALISVMQLLELIKLRGYANIVISSTAAAAVHGIFSPAWGLIVFFPFVIFSATYLIWRNPETSRGFKMCSGVHAIHNCLPGLIFIHEGAMALASTG